MPTIAPIQGITTLTAGSVTPFTDATPAGVWSSTNTGIAMVDVNGNVTAVGVGTVQIVYTVGGDSSAINVSVVSASSLTNGINFNQVYAALQNRVLFQSQGLISDSNRYYEDFHTLNTAAIFDDVRAQDGNTLSQYLANKQREIIMEMINSVYNYKQVIDKPKLAFWRNDLTLPIQLVANTGQFVGLRFYVGKGDAAIKFDSLQVFFTKATTFNLYLYNDFFIRPLKTISVTANAGEETIINLGQSIILNNLVPSQYKNGRWYLGYYQNDIINPQLGNDPANQAVYYPCGYNSFHRVSVLSFSAPLTTDINGDTNFNRNNVGSNNLMYGLNLEISSFVDATNTIVQNADSGLFDELMGLMMAVKSVSSIIYSYRTNGNQSILQTSDDVIRLERELQGIAEEGRPYVMGLRDKVSREIRRVKDGFQKKPTEFVGIA